VSSSLYQRLEEASAAVKKLCPDFPKLVIVLGSGLAGLLDEMEKEKEIPFAQIPHLKQATVEGHVSRLVIGRLNGVRIACMQGRLHLYEGLSLEDVVLPYRAFALAGAETFLLTNAAGGLHPDIKPPSLVLLRDHINLMGNNPLIGKNEERLGHRFPDLTHLYNPKLNDMIMKTANHIGVPLRIGVYVGTHGPSYETPAEIRMHRIVGGDVVGMSTVPEAIAIHHMGKTVVAISCVTNHAAGVTPEALVHDEVLENAKKIYKSFSGLIKEIVGPLEANRG